MGFKPIAPVYDAAALSVLEQAYLGPAARSTSTHIPSIHR